MPGAATGTKSAWGAFGGPTVKFAALFLTAVATMLVRRPDQFRAPYVWCEEGTYMLPQFALKGWAALFEPVNGYLILPSKIINFLSLSLSFQYYPELTALFTLLFSVLAVFAIAYSPTYLPHRMFCALAVLFVPTDPEVFMVGLYAFWWGTLLLFLALLWREDGGHSLLKTAYVAIGGLSSPLVVGVTPLFLWRWARKRNRSDLVALVLCLLLSGVQIMQVLATRTPVHVAYSLDTIKHVLLKYFGYFLWREWLPTQRVDLAVSFALGLALLGFLGWLAYKERGKLSVYFYFLLGALFLSIVVNTLRVDPRAVHPLTGGPRYFFFPWIVLSWLLIWLASVSQRPLRLALIAILLFALLNGAQGMARFHKPVDWRANVQACRSSAEPYTFLIYWDGGPGPQWKTTLTPEQCERMAIQSLF